MEQTQGFGLNSPGTTARKTESLRCSPCIVNGPIGAADGSTRTSKQASGNEGSRTQSDGHVTNISQTGAFVRLESLPPNRVVVELDLAYPDDETPFTVLAFVVHVAPQRGIGVQFIGAADEFRARLDRYLAQLEQI